MTGRWPCRTIHAKKKRWNISVLPRYCWDRPAFVNTKQLYGQPGIYSTWLLAAAAEIDTRRLDSRSLLNGVASATHIEKWRALPSARSHTDAAAA